MDLGIISPLTLTCALRLTYISDPLGYTFYSKASVLTFTLLMSIMKTKNELLKVQYQKMANIPRKYMHALNEVYV